MIFNFKHKTGLFFAVLIVIKTDKIRWSGFLGITCSFRIASKPDSFVWRIFHLLIAITVQRDAVNVSKRCLGTALSTGTRCWSRGVCIRVNYCCGYADWLLLNSLSRYLCKLIFLWWKGVPGSIIVKNYLMFICWQPWWSLERFISRENWIICNT